MSASCLNSDHHLVMCSDRQAGRTLGRGVQQQPPTMLGVKRKGLLRTESIASKVDMGLGAETPAIEVA